MAGTAKPAKRPIILITTRSSTRVKELAFNFFRSTNGELQDWKAQDPLTTLRTSLVANYSVNIDQLDAIDAGIKEELDLVFERVRNDRFPTLAESMQGVYA